MSLLQIVHGPTEPPIQWVAGPISLGLKRPGTEPEHSPFFVTEVKNECSYNFIPAFAFMACIGASCLCNGEVRTDITEAVWRVRY